MTTPDPTRAALLRIFDLAAARPDIRAVVTAAFALPAPLHLPAGENLSRCGVPVGDLCVACAALAPAPTLDPLRRSSYLLLSDFERLEEWCRLVRVVFDGEVPYLVGSAHTTAAYRDIDLRLIVEDETYDATYADPVKVRLVNRAVSIWGQKETGLPIDFQVQRMTEANEAFGGEYRNPMGLRDWTTQVPSGHPGGRRHD